MAITQREDWKEELIQNIKDCGQFLIDNAEKMIGDYKYPCDLIITCYPDSKDRSPYISVDRHIIPEKTIERYWL